PPRRLGSGHPNTGFAFAAAVRVIARGHGDAAHAGAPTHMAAPPCLAQFDGALFDVADLTYGCVAFHRDVTHFAGRHPHLSVFAFLGEQLRADAGTARHLS